MIAILIWFTKRYVLPKIYGTAVPKNKFAMKKSVVLLFVLIVVLPASAHSQARTYRIKRNGGVIGTLFFNQNTKDGDTYLKITSRVNTRVLFSIDLRTEDLAHFKNGQLVSSSVSRSVNGRVKESKKTILVNDSYQQQSGSTSNILNRSISYNMMLLYSIEPVGMNQVYSDHYQCFLPIKKTSEHNYVVHFPDGNYNQYHFENGICRLMVVSHSLYTITMELA